MRVKGSSNRAPEESAQVTVPAFEEPDPGHRHNWSETWSTDTTHHWHEGTGELRKMSTDFSDVPAGNWARSAVDFVSARGIFQGTEEGVFFPDIPMTREMLAMAGFPATTVIHT